MICCKKNGKITVYFIAYYTVYSFHYVQWSYFYKSKEEQYGTWNPGTDYLCRSYGFCRLPRHLRRQGVQVGLPGSPMRTALHPAGICMRFPPFLSPRPSAWSASAEPSASAARLRVPPFSLKLRLFRLRPSLRAVPSSPPLPPPRRFFSGSALFAPRPPSPPPFVPVRSIPRLLLSSHLPATSHSPRLPFSCPLAFLLPFAPAGLPAFASPLRHMTAAPFPC